MKTQKEHADKEFLLQ